MTLPMRNTTRRNKIRAAQSEGRAKIMRAVLPLLKRRYAALKRELRRANLRKRLAKMDGLYKDDVDDNAWDDWIDAFTNALRDALEFGIGNIWAVETEFFATRGKTAQGQLDWREVVDNYETRTGIKIKNIGTDTLTSTQKMIAEWYKTDAGLPELIEKLTPLFGEARAELIAYTEMSFVASEVFLQTMKAYGIGLWNWDAEPDACAEICQPIAAENPYKVGDEMPPEKSHPKCMCGCVYLDENGDEI